jgi:hypothetical protein
MNINYINLQQKMSKIFTLLLCVAAMVPGQLKAQAKLPPNDPLGRIVQLYMNYDTVANTYTVYGKPNFTTTGIQFVMAASSQISIVLPAAEADIDLPIVSLPGAGGFWSENDSWYFCAKCFTKCRFS